MTRSIGPDESCRLVYLPDGTARAQGAQAPLFADASGLVPADVLTLAGDAIAGSVVFVDEYSMIPLVQYPDGVDVIYTSVNDGPMVPLYARVDDRLDALVVRVAAVESGGGGGGADEATLVHKAGAESITGVKTFDVSPVVPTPTTSGQAASKGYADGVGTAAVTAAASDATAKATAAATASADRVLSNLTSAATARTNLGLAGAATLAVGATAGTVAAGDDARFATSSLSSGAAATQRLQWLVVRNIEDISVVLLSDSTGVGASAWFRVMVGLVAPSWPTHTVRYRDINDVTGVYNTPITVQTGSGARSIDFYNAGVVSTNTSHPIGQFFDSRIASLQPTVCMISHGHNEGGVAANKDRCTASYLNLTESVTAACPNTDLILVGQNPEVGNTVQVRAVGWYEAIAAYRGYGFVSVHETFLNDSRWALGTGVGGLMFDTVHPNTAGYALWGATIAPIFTTFRAVDPPVVSQQPSSLLSTQRNLLTNGEFAAYTVTPGAPDNWTAVGGPTVTRDTGTVEDTVKGWSVKLVGSGAAAGEITQDVPVTLVAGRVVTMTARVYVPASAAQSSGAIAIEDDSGSTVTANTNFGRDGWRWISVTRRISATAASCKVHVYAVNAASAGTAYVDRVALIYGKLPMTATPPRAEQQAALDAKANKLTATAVKTSAYTAAMNELVLCDTTGGPFTVTLPAASTAGQVAVRLVGGSSIVTLRRNPTPGTDTLNGGTQTLVTSSGESQVVQSTGAGAWLGVAGFQPLTVLDARYAPITLSARGGDGPVWTGPATVVTHFQSGHGWSFNSALTGGTGTLNDTTEVGLGAQTVKVVTVGGTGTYQHVTKAGLAAQDLTGKKLRVWLKTSDITKIATLALYAAPTGGLASGPYFQWNLLTSAVATASTYGSPLPANEWVPVDVSFADVQTSGSPARTAITEWKLVVADQGTGSATIWLGGIDILPTGLSRFGTNGIVCLNFDDGFVSQWTYARPRLATYGMQATFLPIVDTIGTGSGMTLGQLGELQNTYGHEISGHSYTTANHDTYSGLTLADAELDMQNNLGWLNANGFYSRSFAYPLGAFVPYRSAARRQWRCARTVDTMAGGLSHSPTPLVDPWRVRAMVSVGGTGGPTAASLTTAVTGKLARCKAENSLLILVFHKIVPGAASSSVECSDTDLGSVIDSIASQGIAVATLGQVMAAMTV